MELRSRFPDLHLGNCSVISGRGSDQGTGYRHCRHRFAFQNILQNFLAGILLLLQEPFKLGDLISVTGIEGSVSDIQARATVVTTKEGREVIIPNAVIFANPVAVGRTDTQKS
jgi:hypothetical protein